MDNHAFNLNSALRPDATGDSEVGKNHKDQKIDYRGLAVRSEAALRYPSLSRLSKVDRFRA